MFACCSDEEAQLDAQLLSDSDVHTQKTVRAELDELAGTADALTQELAVLHASTGEARDAVQRQEYELQRVRDVCAVLEEQKAAATTAISAAEVASTEAALETATHVCSWQLLSHSLGVGLGDDDGDGEERAVTVSASLADFVSEDAVLLTAGESLSARLTLRRTSTGMSARSSVERASVSWNCGQVRACACKQAWVYGGV